MQRLKRRRPAGRPRGRVGATAAATGACAVLFLAALPGQSAAAADGPGSYAFQPGAQRIAGAATTSDAKAIRAGSTYRDTIRLDGKLIYRVDLDAKTNAYVSAVAVPGSGAKVAYGDKIEVSLQNRDGINCSSNNAQFGPSTEYPRPLAAYAYRTVDPTSPLCQEAGTYYVVIERTGGDDAADDPWELEIRDVAEPGLSAAGPTRPPENWPSASPAPLVAEPRQRAGGAGFSDATSLTRGEWATKIEPGQSLFYRVPVDWGQQLFTSVDLGSSGGTGYVGGALSVALYNPARGLVDSSDSLSYDGKQKTTSLPPLPPVAYENRFDPSSGDKDMRFAGWYYLRVSLSPEVGKTFGDKAYGLTLETNVKGNATSGPGYAGPAGDFAVTDDDREAATDGRSAAGAAGPDGTMRLVGFAGIGAGTVLVLMLGVWTLLARRRAAGAAGAAGPAGAAGAAGPAGQEPGAGQGFGPPPAW
ncbi:hypothetical protein [Streptomyces sp. AcH 505]|uniref:hypothetical protein n=1 Tax=Streptomyces sp. AcH 505 TaxID=352211 RepID=UPI0026B2955E